MTAKQQTTWESPNNGNGKISWQKYALHISGGVIGILLIITGTLITMGISHLKETITVGFNEVKEGRKEDRAEVKKFFERNEEKVAKLCDEVSRHDQYLRVPYDVRKNYFLTPKERQ
jgi:hypothetical protein